MAKKKSKRGGSDENFFLLHGEKILFAVVIGLFAWMIKSGSGLDRFTLTPEEINKSSSGADLNIQQSKVKPAEVDSSVVVYDYGKYSLLIKNALKVNAYETAIRWDQSLFPDRIKRPSIIPMTVENLKATPCIGAIQYKDKTPGASAGGGMGGEAGKVDGRQWITVTGSIPVRRQLADYMAKFSNAQYTDNLRDQPKYIYYELERGVASDDGEVKWTRIDLIKSMKRENNNWVGVGMEQVDMSYFAPLDPNYPPMAMSCPPMVNRFYGEEIANLPNIPIRSDELMEQASTEMELRNKLTEKMQNISRDEILKRSPYEGSNMMMGGGDMMGGMGGPGMGMGSEMGGGMGNAQTGSQQWMINRNTGMIGANQMNVAPVDYYLFRFFDFDVEKGKTYYYRVKLILANPNYNIDENFVEDPKTTKVTMVESEFSDPSNPVSLGRDARVFAEQVEAPNKPGDDPKATLASIYFDMDSATESLVKGQKVVRGQVANFVRQTHKPLETRTATTMGMGSMDPMGGMDPSMMGKSKKKKGAGKDTKTVDHISDVCVLDLFGGYRIPGSDLRSPGKMLLLEPSGLVQIKEVREDTRELKRIEQGGAKPALDGGLGSMGPAGSLM